eukprot:6192290-Pleurochrysis_carterae.AAC.1
MIQLAPISPTDSPAGSDFALRFAGVPMLCRDARSDAGLWHARCGDAVRCDRPATDGTARSATRATRVRDDVGAINSYARYKVLGMIN